ncbi:ARABIDOPSIS THALIANA OVATE FAMILY PROTEIN 7, ovate family protein 7 [Hibiscus trionum]|uniref:Transcription repressor n=1 Tax=Hibiscus trionum TaxID=183268 RepID=A0A9W7LKY1_HIBTR|nr:ARABIDOPSIS THALIANA OVATE FAMILY PROTEIN 7, ovate family protein 7 [Hibiscus trionum]
MAKRFKLKIFRVFTSFQSCRSKDPSNLPLNPVPLFCRLYSVTRNPITRHLPPPPLPTQPKSTKVPRYSSLKRHVSSAFSSIGCGLGPRSSAKYLSETDRSESSPPSTLEFHWEEEDRWRVIAKVYDDDKTPRRKIYNTSENDDDLFPHPAPPNTIKKKRRYKKRKTTPKIRISTSSAESGLFSSESFEDDDINAEETETLVSSSRSFSTDSCSEMFNANLEAILETKPTGQKKKKPKKVKKTKRYAVRISSSESESPARLSSFLQRMIPCTVDGKVRESFAVVKKSAEPYEDFKKSMMDMILEKQMFEEKDLEQLLHCFLSLNSRFHHRVIVQAFSEIWEALFSPRSTSFRLSCALN